MPITEYYIKSVLQIESEATTGTDDILELEESESAQEE